MPKRSRSFSTRPDQLSRDPRVLLPDPRSDDAQSPGQRYRHELSLGDLLYERRAEAHRRGHHRRCRGLGSLARQGGDRGRAGRRLLGGRAGASGLSRALSRTATPAILSGRTGNCRSAGSSPRPNDQAGARSSASSADFAELATFVSAAWRAAATSRRAMAARRLSISLMLCACRSRRMQRAAAQYRSPQHQPVNDVERDRVLRA